MDLLCANIVEEILRRLPAKYLHRVRAVSRRYNDIVINPGFVARYWQSHPPYLTGVFLQTESLIRPWGHFPDFLGGSPRPSATESIFASDLGFLPHLPESQLQVGTMGSARIIFILHSTSGLLLCSRGRNNEVQYYVCNPVSWQWVSLPELPWRSYCRYGILSVTDNGDGIIRLPPDRRYHLHERGEYRGRLFHGAGHNEVRKPPPVLSHGYILVCPSGSPDEDPYDKGHATSVEALPC